MPWTEITRVEYRRDGLRYASDMTDAEWALIARRFPPRRRLGRPRTTDLRRVVEAMLYVLATGCQWRALPGDFPPRSTVQGYFYAWRDTRWWQRIVTALVRRARPEEPEENEFASPCCSTRHGAALACRIVGNHVLVPLEFLPLDVAFVPVLDQHIPFRRRTPQSAPHALAAILDDRLARRAPDLATVTATACRQWALRVASTMKSKSYRGWRWRRLRDGR
jgi:transposase